MLKIGSKRRRPRDEILQARVAEEEKEAEYQKKLSELKSFENQLKIEKSSQENGKEAMSILNGLIKAGQIKQNKDTSWQAVGGSHAVKI